MEVAILAHIIKMSIIILSFVSECYMMEELSSKIHQNIIHKYISCLKVPRSQSSTGRCTNRNQSVSRVLPEAQIKNLVYRIISTFSRTLCYICLSLAPDVVQSRAGVICFLWPRHASPGGFCKHRTLHNGWQYVTFPLYI